jgi:hypothetical protein
MIKKQPRNQKLIIEIKKKTKTPKTFTEERLGDYAKIYLLILMAYCAG